MGKKETRPAFSFCPLSHSRDYGSLSELALPEERLVLAEPKLLFYFFVDVLNSGYGGEGTGAQSAQVSQLSFLFGECLTAGGLTLKKRYLRAQTWPLGQGKGPAD